MKTGKIISSALLIGMLSACSYTGDKYSVYFDSGSSVAKQSSAAEIAKIAKMAKQDGKNIKLTGYTDSTGSKSLNKKLSEKRIAYVSTKLARMGVNPEKIKSDAIGEGWVDKKDSNNKDKRRVEISVY